MEVQLSRKDINQRWGITIKEDIGETFVAKLIPGTPAGSSGLEIGDIITHVNSQNVKTHGKRQVLEIIRKLRSMSLKFDRPKDSSKKPPTLNADLDVVFVSSSNNNSDAEFRPKISKNDKGKIAKKRGRPAGSKKRSPKFNLGKPKTSQPVPQAKTMLEKLADSTDSEDEHSYANAEVLLDIQLEHQQQQQQQQEQQPQRGKLKERRTSSPPKKSKKPRSSYATNGSEMDAYSWQKENPYKQMKNGEAKINGNTKKLTGNNPLDHLAKCAEAELTKIAADSEKTKEALSASLVEQEIVIDELKKARLEERRKIDEAQFKNKQLTRAFKSLQSSSRSETEKLKGELAREKQKNAELIGKYNEMKEAQDSVCKELSKTRSDLQKALSDAEAGKQKRTDAVSKATELINLIKNGEF